MFLPHAFPGTAGNFQVVETFGQGEKKAENPTYPATHSANEIAGACRLQALSVVFMSIKHNIFHQR